MGYAATLALISVAVMGLTVLVLVVLRALRPGRRVPGPAWPGAGAGPASGGTRAAESRIADRRAGSRGEIASQESLFADVADVDALFTRVDRQFGARDGRVLLTSRITRLRDRQVPVSSVSPAQGVPAVQVLFADGTVVYALGEREGDMGVLALRATRSAMCIAEAVAVQGGMRIVFARTAPGERDRRSPWSHRDISAYAVGLDQPA